MSNNNKLFDVIGFGALNVDTLLKVDRIAGPEEESFIENYSESCGGSAANTIVGLARLGRKVGFVGKIADDHEGKLQLDNFINDGVDIKGIIHSKKGKSGAVIGFVDKRGARALYINPGENDTLESREIDLEYVAQAKFLHISSFVGERPFRAQKKLAGMLPDSIKLSFDPGALYAQRGIVAIEPLIRSSYVFMPNNLELEQLTGEKDYRKGADTILEMGVKIVAVKLGAKGCYVTDGQEQVTIDAFPVKVLDTTGAGDAFDAGFLYGLLDNKNNLYECGRLGNFVASKSVTANGARTGLPYQKELSYNFS
ncbi:MAG: carbohydrate kinase family protein [Nitrososphaerota archaeon]|jgi:ribokinase|uniref:carbohydrate kinase family protein n=1 Tax=Candidatus Bathycorpusculum sp. TaxID=2994959 RepID=UPI002825A1C1|nr:carbohydrate kinase family protein [Candidatus Termiticorpusculum sp.]MCL2257889.1 carbohydrate kinase family protein [Candidatus Termiticorpusculum sp.]MCL2291994.1 carbohydrate kinase family protein [Candidatus Termiticorpusculum sp.]MDR0459933.1 carbohydrate kinase family protein [Nitrososphaerota archaeon]